MTNKIRRPYEAKFLRKPEKTTAPILYRVTDRGHLMVIQLTKFNLTLNIFCEILLFVQLPKTFLAVIFFSFTIKEFIFQLKHARYQKYNLIFLKAIFIIIYLL